MIATAQAIDAQTTRTEEAAVDSTMEAIETRYREASARKARRRARQSPMARARVALEAADSDYWQMVDSCYRVTAGGDEWLDSFTRIDDNWQECSISEALAYLMAHWDGTGARGYHGRDLAVWAGDRIVATITRASDGQPRLTRFQAGGIDYDDLRSPLLRAVALWDVAGNLLQTLKDRGADPLSDELDEAQVAATEAEHALIKAILEANGRDVSNFDPDRCEPFRPCGLTAAGYYFSVTTGPDPFGSSDRIVATLVVVDAADLLELPAR